MPLLVTGSIGIDTVKTPFGESENCLGGSAVYFSYTASFFSPVRFVGVIGPDCPFKLADIFKGKDVAFDPPLLHILFAEPLRWSEHRWRAGLFPALPFSLPGWLLYIWPVEEWFFLLPQ